MHELLWRQWTSLGAGLEDIKGRESPSGHMIDPEALLLATTAFGRREPRLFDEALDWLVHFGSLINLQRLKNLQSSGLGDVHVLRAVAAFVQRHGRLSKWGALAQNNADNVKTTPEPFFILDGTASVHWGEPDPDFSSKGWLRGEPRLRGLCMKPAPDKVANALLTLRALIGVSSRCEIILCLLTRPSARAAELAHLTGYSPQSIQSALSEMELSGRLLTDGERSDERHSRVVRGKSKRYFLHLPDWFFILPAESSPRWLPWASLFAVTQKIVGCLLVTPAVDPLLLSMQVRRILEMHATDLTENGLMYQLGYSPDMTGEVLVRTLAERLPAVLSTL